MEGAKREQRPEQGWWQGKVAVDHVVVAAPSLEQAVEAVADRLGVVPTPGGSHPGRGTRNALLGLGNGAYLEAIGPDPKQPAPVGGRPFGIDTLDRARLVTWAVRGRSLQRTVGSFRRCAFTKPEAMSRRGVGGEMLQWQLAFPDVGGPLSFALNHAMQPIPFLIDWGETPHPGLTLTHQVELEAVIVSGEGTEMVQEVLEASWLPMENGVDVRLQRLGATSIVAEISTATGLVRLED